MSENIRVCPKCGGNHTWKNGKVNGGNQRFFCRDCKYNYTNLTDVNFVHPSTKPEHLKTTALKLYLKGSSLRDIEDLLGNQVSDTTIQKWVKRGEKKSNRNK